MKGLTYWFVSLVLVLGVVLSACGAPQKTEIAPAPEKPAATSSGAGVPGASQLTREEQLIEGAKKEGVVVYWTHSFPNPDQVIKPFQAKYPFLKVQNWDARGPEISAKIMQEAQAKRYSVDVITTGELDFLPSSTWKDLVAEYDWPNTKGWPFQRNNNYYRNFSGTVRGTSYNSSQLSAADAPKTWEDINNIKWRGKAVISTSANEVPLYFAYAWGQSGKLDWDKAFNFWRDVMRNARPQVVSGFTGPLELHAAGAYAIFIQTSLPRALEYKFKGAPLEIASAPSVNLTFHAMGIAKNAPHPNAARLFADFLTSPEGNLAFNNAAINVAIDPVAAKTARANLEFARAGIKLSEIPVEFATEENFKKSTDFWLTELGRER